MTTPMNKRNDESLWRARARRRIQFQQQIGSFEANSDKVIARLLERGRIAASSLERRLLDQRLLQDSTAMKAHRGEP